MRDYKIITDSCGDIPGDLLEKYDIDYARMNTVNEGKETPASLTWEYFTAHELYETIRGGVRVTTTQVPPTEFQRIFDLYLSQNKDIIYIGCSLKQSGSVNTGAVVAKELLEKYPDAKIECIDSLNASIGEGILAIEAAKLKADGKSFDETVETIIAMRNNINQYVTVGTLEYLKRCGRVSGSSAFFGNLMGVKPILISDADGYQTPVKKAKGRMGSFTEVANLLSASIGNAEGKTLYIAHADCNEAELDAFKKVLIEKFPNNEIVVGYIGPIVGASIGPDAIGVWTIGNEVTYRVSESK